MSWAKDHEEIDFERLMQDALIEIAEAEEDLKHFHVYAEKQRIKEFIQERKRNYKSLSLALKKALN